MRIIVDAMGGDNAPLAPVEGAIQAAKEYGVEIVLVGRREEIEKALQENSLALPEGVTLASGNSTAYIASMAAGGTGSVSFQLLPSATYTGGVATVGVSLSAVGKDTGAPISSSTSVTVPVIQPERFELTNLDEIFHPLENFRTADILLGKEKARLKRMERHSSWLRIYAIKLSEGVYVITGGAIKLTLKMEEREHTRLELMKMEKVRSFLLKENIIDDDSFVEYMNTL